MVVYLAVVTVNEEFNNVIKHFQAKQIKINEIQVKLVLSYPIDESTIKNAYIHKLHDIIDSQLDIAIFIVDNIENEVNGKYKYFISEYK